MRTITGLGDPLAHADGIAVADERGLPTRGPHEMPLVQAVHVCRACGDRWRAQESDLHHGASHRGGCSDQGAV